MRIAWPRLPEICCRVAIVATVVLVLGRLFGATLCEALLPLLEAAMKVMAPDFTLQSAEVVRGNTGALLQVAAGPAHPLWLNGRLLQPFGTGTMPPGGFLVSVTVGGVLGASELTLIAALAWPAYSLQELLLRSGLALLAAVSLLLFAPLTLVAELWGGVHDLVQSGQVPAVLVASRFLMGGGAAALGLVAAVAAVRLAAPAQRAAPARTSASAA
jgi:hypothetical protein